MEKETKLKIIKVLSYVFLVSVFIVGVFFYYKTENNNNTSAEIVKAFTEKIKYSQTDEIKVEIENKENKTICFSACYPYKIQVKNNNWNSYSYSECDKEDIVETCINPNQSKAFIIVSNEVFLKPAVHRLAIPVCIDCAIGEQFRVDKIIYSNEFEIK